MGLPPPRLANRLDEEAFGYILNDQPSTIFSVFIPPPPEEVIDKQQERTFKVLEEVRQVREMTAQINELMNNVEMMCITTTGSRSNVDECEDIVGQYR